MIAEDDDPFEVLGIRRQEATRADVQAAFRRSVLLAHPDKGGQGRDVPSFDRLVNARNAALAEIERLERQRRGRKGRRAAEARAEGEAEAEAEGEAEGEDPLSPVALFSWIALAALKCTTAKPVEIAIEATLEDVYSARVKRVVVWVLRVPHAFRRTRQVIMVPLALPSATMAVDAAPLVFPGMGDDSVADILLKRERPERRSDVRVHVKLLMDPRSCFVLDTVLNPCDLHATVPVSLHARYYGRSVNVRLPSGGAVEAVFDPKGEEKQVRVFKGAGLPYLIALGDVGGRGDLYVFLEVRLPVLGDQRLADPAVRSLLAELSL